MKKYTIILLALVLVSFACCKKEANRQYSYWVVNNDSFSTNEVNATIGKAVTKLNSNNISNRFSLTFFLGYNFPTTGYFYLRRGDISQNPDSAELNFYYKNQFYIPSANNTTVLTASQIGDKVRYTLQLGWFVNYYNVDDSVLIHGVFNEP